MPLSTNKTYRWFRRRARLTMRAPLIALGLLTPSCFWVWLGDVWDEDGNDCPQSCTCEPPPDPGTIIGQFAVTECKCPE